METTPGLITSSTEDHRRDPCGTRITTCSGKPSLARWRYTRTPAGVRRRHQTVASDPGTKKPGPWLGNRAEHPQGPRAHSRKNEGPHRCLLHRANGDQGTSHIPRALRKEVRALGGRDLTFTLVNEQIRLPIFR